MDITITVKTLNDEYRTLYGYTYPDSVSNLVKAEFVVAWKMSEGKTEWGNWGICDRENLGAMLKEYVSEATKERG